MSRPLDNLFEELSGPSMPLGPTDWPEPASLRRRAEHRRTVRRASIASTLAVVAAVAVAVPATLAGHHEAPISPGATTTPPAAHTTAATPRAAATTTPGAPLAAGEPTPQGLRVSFGTFSLVIPQGWTAVPSRASYDGQKHVSHRVCISPPAAPTTRSLYGCAGLDVYYGAFLPGSGTRPFSDPQLGRTRSSGWHHGTAAATCPAKAGAVGSPVVGELDPPDSAYSVPRVGNAKADYNVWTVQCADGTTFHPQSWFLPRSTMVAFVYDGDAAAAAVLSTVITRYDQEHPSS